MVKNGSLAVYCSDGGGMMLNLIDDIDVEFNYLSFDLVFGEFSEGYDGRIWRELKIT